MSETLCRCGAMRMLDPRVSCQRGGTIHAVSACAPTNPEVASLRAALRSLVEAAREQRMAILRLTEMLRYVLSDVERSYPALARDIGENLDDLEIAKLIARSGAACDAARSALPVDEKEDRRARDR